MEDMKYTIVFKKLSEAQEDQAASRQIASDSEEIAQLSKIVSEVSEPSYKFITTT